MPAIAIKGRSDLTAWLILALTGTLFFVIAVHCVEKAKD